MKLPTLLIYLALTSFSCAAWSGEATLDSASDTVQAICVASDVNDNTCLPVVTIHILKYGKEYYQFRPEEIDNLHLGIKAMCKWGKPETCQEIKEIKFVKVLAGKDAGRCPSRDLSFPDLVEISSEHLTFPIFSACLYSLLPVENYILNAENNPRLCKPGEDKDVAINLAASDYREMSNGVETSGLLAFGRTPTNLQTVFREIENTLVKEVMTEGFYSCQY